MFWRGILTYLTWDSCILSFIHSYTWRVRKFWHGRGELGGEEKICLLLLEPWSVKRNSYSFSYCGAAMESRAAFGAFLEQPYSHGRDCSSSGLVSPSSSLSLALFWITAVVY
eukprot:Gb_25377 [translate_table: standard]